jgi:NTE family protein
MSDPQLKPTALLLPGGGARVAYQVGVLRALGEITGHLAPNPFPIICGTSAGAINAAALASRADNFARATAELEQLWRKLTVAHVYRSDICGVAWNTLRLVFSLFNAGIAAGRPVALLDNSPLRETLLKAVDFDAISEHIATGALRAVCVTAMNYSQSMSTSFFQGGPAASGWQRWRRQGIPSPLSIKHLMASSAIPTIFPPEPIGPHYFGDGALRQLNPISPALHLGAERVLVIAASGHRRTYERPPRPIQSPAFGQIIGHLLNSAFIDSLESDIELLERINEMIRCQPQVGSCHATEGLKPVDLMVLSPSQDIDAIAGEHFGELPLSMRLFLRLSGGSSDTGGINTASYLLFTPNFIAELINLGYSDTMAERERIAAFMAGRYSEKPG